MIFVFTSLLLLRVYQKKRLQVVSALTLLSHRSFLGAAGLTYDVLCADRDHPSG